MAQDPILAATQGMLPETSKIKTTFDAYIKVTSPLDGLIYWTQDLNVKPLKVPVILHSSRTVEMSEERSVTSGDWIITTSINLKQTGVQLWVNQDHSIAINEQTMFNNIAGTFHYIGKTITVDFDSFLHNPTKLIIPNCIPLLIQTIPDIAPNGALGVPTYGSMTAPVDVTAPYAIVDVKETVNLTTTGQTSKNGAIGGMARDTVEITLQNCDQHQLVTANWGLTALSDVFGFGTSFTPSLAYAGRHQESMNVKNAQSKIKARINYPMQTAIDAAFKMLRQIGLDFAVGNKIIRITAGV